jgi:hypothetical protein
VPPPCYDHAFFMVLRWQRAPREVKTVLKYLHSDIGQRTWRAPYKVRKDGTRQTLNDRLCRLVGLNPDEVDLPVTVQNFLTN